MGGALGNICVVHFNGGLLMSSDAFVHEIFALLISSRINVGTWIKAYTLKWVIQREVAEGDPVMKR